MKKYKFSPGAGKYCISEGGRHPAQDAGDEGVPGMPQGDGPGRQKDRTG